MEFDWDDGNRDKNRRHGVHDYEIEEALEDKRALIVETTAHQGEIRNVSLGRAQNGKYLRVVYTSRVYAGVTLARPISAAEMSRADRRRYGRRK